MYLFKRKGKIYHNCFSFLKRLPSFHSLLLHHTSLESKYMYKPVAIKVKYPEIQKVVTCCLEVMALDIRAHVPNCGALTFFVPGF